jgi:hypothetical protein
MLLKIIVNIYIIQLAIIKGDHKMKKIMLFITISLISLVSFCTSVQADSTSNGMGFSVDSSQYGI